MTRARTPVSARDTVDLCVPSRRPISSRVRPSSTYRARKWRVRGSSPPSASTSADRTTACSARRSSEASGSGPGAASSAMPRCSGSVPALAPSRFSATRSRTERSQGSRPPRPWYSASFGPRGPSSSRSRVRWSTSERSSSSRRSRLSARGSSARRPVRPAARGRPGIPRAPRRRGRDPPRGPGRHPAPAPGLARRRSGGRHRGRLEGPGARAARPGAHHRAGPRGRTSSQGVARPGTRSPLTSQSARPAGPWPIDAASVVVCAADRPGE